MVVVVLFLFVSDLFSFGMGIGARAFYRQDYFRWSFKDGGINIRSELTWRDVRVAGFELEEKFFIGDKYYLHCSFDYGFILSGTNQDSDYGANNRELEFSRSINDAGKGRVMGASIGFGELFHFRDMGISVIPLIGLLFKRQEFKIFDGYQVISRSGFSKGELPTQGEFISGLDSSYTANWFGIYLGLDFDYRVFSFWSVNFLSKLSLLYYYAYADWNLREEFNHPISFIQQSVAFGGHLAFVNYFYIGKNMSFSLGLFADVMFCGGQGVSTIIQADRSRINSAYNGAISTSIGGNFGIHAFF